MRLLDNLLSRFVRTGHLTVIDAGGARHGFGSAATGPSVTVRFHDRAVEREIFLNPELKAAEAYMDGRLTIEEGGTIADLIGLATLNRRSLGAHPAQKALRRVWRLFRRRQQSNAIGQAAANVRSHYDHPAAFYRLWLDERMAYSCAYFEEPGLSLEAAQVAKFRLIAAKLDLRPGMSVAEIGSGWGGLAIYLAKVAGARVTAINVSPEQIAESRRRIDAAGVSDRVDVIEIDYRRLEGRFDRVVSVGMMEHVGAPHFDSYFGTVRRLTAPGGFALVHAIGRMSPPGTTGPFIRKHIFPGGYSPALSEVFAATERSGLWVADCEVLRLHYARTIRHWAARFQDRRGDVVALMGERFARMWEYYLAAVELEFVNGSHMVFQLLLTETRDGVPLTRDFIAANRAALALRETETDYLTATAAPAA